MEVCVDNLQSVCNALEGGATRLELCSALSEGGLTPTIGFVKQAKKIVADKMELHALIRARGGDFTYSQEEIDLMTEDVRQIVSFGIDGIVLGCLDTEGNVDLQGCQILIKAAKEEAEKKKEAIEISFHRAFDVSCDWKRSIEDIKKLGCQRLLTSGQGASALDGADLIRQLVQQNPQLIITPGGGITEHNLTSILQKSGAKSFHASARVTFPSATKFRRSDCRMGTNSSEDTIMVTSVERVNKMVQIFNEILAERVL